MTGHSDTQFLPEVWTLYGIGVSILLSRFVIRIKTVGIKGFQGDDYFSILTLGLYTMNAAIVHIIFGTGTNIEASILQQTRPLTRLEIAQFEFGSKEQLAATYSYTALIWSMKATILFFFYRLTMGLWQHKYIKPIAVVCGVSYVVVLATLTFGCYPMRRNWQVVPDPGQSCTVRRQHFLVIVILNVITDALVLLIPIPFLCTLRTPLRQKLIISLFLCSGIVIIAAAITRAALTLDRNPSATQINRWGIREIFLGVITVNALILRPLFSKYFWERASWTDVSLWTESIHFLDGGAGVGGVGFELRSSAADTDGEGDRKSTKGGLSVQWEKDLEANKPNERSVKGHKRGQSSASTLVSRSVESLQHIIQGSRRGDDNFGGERGALEVRVVTSFQVERETIDGTRVVEKGDVQGQREEEWERNGRFGGG